MSLQQIETTAFHPLSFENSQQAETLNDVDVVSDGNAGKPIIFIQNGHVFTNQTEAALLGLFARAMCGAINLADAGFDKKAFAFAQKAYRDLACVCPPNETFDILYTTTMKHIASCACWKADELTGAHPAFQSQISHLIPGAKLASKGDFHPDGKADFLVWVGGEKRPVEIKRDAFCGPHVKQLRRYMNVYRASVGYACAYELKAELPADMIFLQLQREH
jgi:hypothetical protein